MDSEIVYAVVDVVIGKTGRYHPKELLCLDYMSFKHDASVLKHKTRISCI